jgi:hypothetical protein
LDRLIANFREIFGRAATQEELDQLRYTQKLLEEKDAGSGKHHCGVDIPYPTQILSSAPARVVFRKSLKTISAFVSASSPTLCRNPCLCPWVKQNFRNRTVANE